MRSTSISALGFLLSICPINATVLQSLDSRAATPITGYTYSGCYTEATNGRALTGSSYFDDSMTVQKCAAACANFNFFGVEYGRECYCGNNLNAGSHQDVASACSFTCPGNSAETCGGSNHLDLYQKAARVPPPYTAQGCYTDDPNHRTLTDASFTSEAMTVQLCAADCQGYAYFGVEYFRECYCGNTVASTGVPAPASQCDAPCSGDSTQICGGSSKLNLYHVN